MKLVRTEQTIKKAGKLTKTESTTKHDTYFKIKQETNYPMTVTVCTVKSHCFHSGAFFIKRERRLKGRLKITRGDVTQLHSDAATDIKQVVAFKKCCWQLQLVHVERK